MFLSLKNIVLFTSIFSCSLSLVKAVDMPTEWPEEGKGSNKNHISIKPQSSYAHLFVLKNKKFFNPRFK